MQNLYENFLHENFYTRMNYSNTAVIHVNHMKTLLYKKFYHKNKANCDVKNSITLLIFNKSAL